MSRHERVISLPNLSGGYSLTLSSNGANTLVIRLVPDGPDNSTVVDAGGGGTGGGGGFGCGDVNANDSFDSGYQGYTPTRNRNTYHGFKNGLNKMNNGYYSLPIRKKSKADYADLQEGDRVLSINSKSVRNAARDVAMAYIDEANDSLDLEIVRTRSANPRMQDRQMNMQKNQDKQSSADRRMSNGSNAVRKVTTTTTRIKTTKDGERLQETVTKTVMESLDGETPKTVAQTTSERNDMAGPVRKQIGVTEHTAPIKMDRGRRTSDVIITHPQKPTTDRPRVSGNVSVGQPSTITIDNQHKQGTWQATQRQPSPAKQQPVYQQMQQPQRQQPQHQQQKPKPKFEMPKPSDNPRYAPPGPKTGFALQFRQPAPVQKSKKQSAYEPVSIMQSKPSGRELTITFAMPDENTKVDFGSPPESPSGMSVDSGVPPESPLKEDSTDVYRDPSIILRSLAKDQPLAERLQRPYSEPAGRVTEEPEVSIVEKRRACKTIADLLMFPKNKQAKGARMFAKRRKRSARYTIEATGQKDSDEDSEGSSTGESGAAIITIKTAPPPPPPPMMNGRIPAPPPPPPGGFTQRIKVEPTNFNVKLKSKAKCEHVSVSPKQCLVLAAGLKGQSGGRAAEMFEKRRLRSEQFVLDESTIKHAKPSSFSKPPGPEKSTTAEIHIKKLSPWEAAQESPVGSVSRAFPKKEVKIPPPMKIPPPTQAKPKPAAQLPAKPGFKASRDLPKYPAPQAKDSIPLKPGSTLPKANFKDFNVKPRGWGRSSTGDNRSGSPASLNSDQGSTGRGQIGTKPLKYGGGFNDFNPKPRLFGIDSPRHGALSPTVSLAESDDL
eukprot:XP_011680477.1 PREDICTED: serine/arginine repetitive matrix protein 1 isoform X1 [Strongylocentrotus purpuratus]